MRIIDFRLRRTHTQFFQKGSKLFFIEKLLALLFLTLCIVFFGSVEACDGNWCESTGKKMMDDCCGMTKRHRKYAHFEIVWRYIKDKWTEGECFGFFFSSSVMERFFLVFFKSLRIYCWFGDIIDWHPSPSQSPSEMWLLKCSSENWNATRKKEYTHTHTLESGQMVIESGIQMRCSYQIVLCDLLASWGHFEQKHFGSMFSNATPSRSQNTL